MWCVAEHVHDLQRFLCSAALSCAFVLQVMIVVPSGCSILAYQPAYIVVVTSRSLASLSISVF